MEFINRSQAKKSTNLAYLGGVSTSSKIKKNAKVLNIDTFALYLAPYKLSGYNTCIGATKDCINACLNETGQAGMQKNAGTNIVIKARIKKTKLFYEQKDFFMQWLIVEIKSAKNLSLNRGNEFAVRLNCTSDINWQRFKFKGKNIFEYFPNIQFYDYTKVVSRFNNIPDNYHLTFSYTGKNWEDCINVLDKGYNVAAVFNIYETHNMRPENIKPLPTKYKGFPVIDGDITDYRPMDVKGSIVALRFKKIADKANEKEAINSVFVIDPNTKDCTYKTEKVLTK